MMATGECAHRGGFGVRVPGKICRQLGGCNSDESGLSNEFRNSLDFPRDIALNSEGQAKSKPQDKITLPIILALMASRPLDQDHHDGADAGNGLGMNATGGAAGLGLIGTVIGLAGGSPNFAAGIGYWGAARATYYRQGPKDRLRKKHPDRVQTTPRRSAPMKSDKQP
jgi:hypothetical protein